jgi:hypothetical protein
MYAFSISHQEAEEWLSNLPRLHDLYQHSKKDDPKNYFNFEEFFPIAFLGNAAYAEIEKVLTRLDPVAWEKLRKKALSQVTADDPLRRYHQLFNALNEARGYGYLLEDGQTQIEFIEDLTGKSPDLLAWKNGAKTLLEVKTLNQSDDDIMNEDSRRNEAIKIDPTLSVGFETRIKRSIRDARKQLDRYSAERKIVYLFAEMESHQRTCFESYNKLKLFIADQNINDLRVVGLASPMMICF